MSSEKIKQFNEILNSFLIQISPLVGTTYHYHFQQIAKINSILPVEQFLVHALPMREKIFNRDESYFNNNDNYTEKIGKKQSILDEIVRLQGIYSQLDENSKSNVWDIFQALLIIGEEYLQLNKNKYLQ
jgi:hypothetical protein